ncbi:hypothetical protein [Parendozoicomonas haliclonae]
MSDIEVDLERSNQEEYGQDGRADALSAVALILLAVGVAVFWVSGH